VCRLFPWWALYALYGVKPSVLSAALSRALLRSPPQRTILKTLCLPSRPARFAPDHHWRFATLVAFRSTPGRRRLFQICPKSLADGDLALCPGAILPSFSPRSLALPKIWLRILPPIASTPRAHPMTARSGGDPHLWPRAGVDRFASKPCLPGSPPGRKLLVN